MKLSIVLACYIVALILDFAKATTIFNYIGKNCEGAYGQCTNIPPDHCCTSFKGNTLRSSRLTDKPLKAVARAWRTRVGKQCAEPVSTRRLGEGLERFCARVEEEMEYSGVTWDYIGRKDQRREKRCAGYRSMDKIVLADGRTFEVGSGPNKLLKRQWFIEWLGNQTTNYLRRPLKWLGMEGWANETRARVHRFGQGEPLDADEMILDF